MEGNQVTKATKVLTRLAPFGLLMEALQSE